MLWAAETKKLVDVFIIFTDQPCGTYSSDDVVTPVKALRQYCDTMSHPNTRYDAALNLTVTSNKTVSCLLWIKSHFLLELTFQTILFGVYFGM